MNATELLTATGNVWQVDCWESGNRRRLVRRLFVRTDCILKAEEIARQRSGRRCVDARPWNPANDRSVYGWIREVTE
jgi:hypothetical protein